MKKVCKEGQFRYKWILAASTTFIEQSIALHKTQKSRIQRFILFVNKRTKIHGLSLKLNIILWIDAEACLIFVKNWNLSTFVFSKLQAISIKITFIEFCVSNVGQIDWNKFCVEKCQWKWGFIDTHAYKVIKTNRFRNRDFVWLHFFGDLTCKLSFNPSLDFLRNWQAFNFHDIFETCAKEQKILISRYLDIELRLFCWLNDI